MKRHVKSNRKKKGDKSLIQLACRFKNWLTYQKFIKGKDVNQYSKKHMKAKFLINSKSNSFKSENHSEDKLVKAVAENKELNAIKIYKSELSI